MRTGLNFWMQVARGSLCRSFANVSRLALLPFNPLSPLLLLLVVLKVPPLCLSLCLSVSLTHPPPLSLSVIVLSNVVYMLFFIFILRRRGCYSCYYSYYWSCAWGLCHHLQGLNLSKRASCQVVFGYVFLTSESTNWAALRSMSDPLFKVHRRVCVEKASCDYNSAVHNRAQHSTPAVPLVSVVHSGSCPCSWYFFSPPLLSLFISPPIFFSPSPSDLS